MRHHDSFLSQSYGENPVLPSWANAAFEFSTLNKYLILGRNGYDYCLIVCLPRFFPTDPHSIGWPHVLGDPAFLVLTRTGTETPSPSLTDPSSGWKKNSHFPYLCIDKDAASTHIATLEAFLQLHISNLLDPNCIPSFFLISFVKTCVLYSK